MLEMTLPFFNSQVIITQGTKETNLYEFLKIQQKNLILSCYSRQNWNFINSITQEIVQKTNQSHQTTQRSSVVRKVDR